MIDKNDVKMPEQNEDTESLLNDRDAVHKIEDLLELVNSADNRQELRLNQEYYSRFHWFGGSSKNSYFSYQEEAVYDFIFNLNKSGILSDQVGMGKTIEAGMIISELASRSELRSLLIIVPNEIMAEKWEYELAEKFGIKDYKGIYPQVKSLRNYNDFCKAVFECIAEEKFGELYYHEFTHTYTSKKEEALADVMRSYILADIKEAVRMINDGFLESEVAGSPQVEFNGKEFKIKGTAFKREYVYDRKGRIAEFVNGRQNQRLETTINNRRFVNDYKKSLVIELESLYTLVGDYFTTLPNEISNVSEIMTKRYPILVIPISYSEQSDDGVKSCDFLNKILSSKFENYKHKYNVKGKDGVMETVFEEYRIIDFFIDVGYQTLIVDEVHDYIDVSAKVERRIFHNNLAHYEATYSSSEYNRYELFDDYYFIKKSSLYKKLKALADKANRKIFLTATPIKSDMVDFYLLTLLASNKDSDAYKRIGKNLDTAFPTQEAIEKAVDSLYGSFKNCLPEAVQYYCGFSERFLATEADNGKKFRYPYFNNSYLLANKRDEDVLEYMKSHVNYMSVEEIIMELILAYYAECKAGKGKAAVTEELEEKTLEDLEKLLADSGSDLQTRIVFRAILNNSIKIRFEEDFTREDGKPVKRIRELLEMEDGPRKWFKTYKKYGIRHTRHQTYNLSQCNGLEKLSKTKIERYKNLPVWPKRDGKVIFLLRDDIFFDNFLNVTRGYRASAGKKVRLEDLPNYDKLNGSEEEITQRFESAIEIFDYINNAMSGGRPDTHEPQSNRYESVGLDDKGMVDYKLALINKLMLGRDSALGSVRKKVLLFAEHNREEITEWFKYQKCKPLYTAETELDPAKVKAYAKKRDSYAAGTIGPEWFVSESTDDLSDLSKSNLLIIIDPKRYEKGVDLQKADTIINFDINYDPLKMEQRIGRIDRIRPASQSQEINIVSFVPLNDMSGFIINFFANELKMFTQWMGETTGIVSVPDEGEGGGEEVSFEQKIEQLELYYKDIYRLCTGDVPAAEQKKMAERFSKFFGVNDYKAKVDFEYLQKLRPLFDKAFRSSISPQRGGYAVTDGGNTRIVRFNSSLGVFSPCVSARCEGCRNLGTCGASADRKNSYDDFQEAVKRFFVAGSDFYLEKGKEFQNMLNQVSVSGSATDELVELVELMHKREGLFVELGDKVKELLPKNSDSPFTVPLEEFNAIFTPLKQLYWDEVVGFYLDKILERFHSQCDNVLRGAELFENFIKTFSIADFMSNMEGSV